MAVVTLSLAVAGCSLGPSGADAPAASEPVRLPAAESWAPAPVRTAGLRTVATADEAFALHVRQGRVGFVPGVNLGATVPGHHPGELAIDAHR